MKILITGSSGLIGSAAIKSFTRDGQIVGRLLRKKTTDHAFWDIENKIIDLDNFPEPDVVLHLAGENLSEGRWTEKKKSRILNSRVKSTQLLADYFTQSNHKPKVFISGSAIGYYGDRGDEPLNENNLPGDNFSAEICKQWEAASQPLKRSGIRLVNIRTGVVLSKQGGALKKMLTPFKLGLGGKMGNGKQYFSWISMTDMVNALKYIIDNDIYGPVNMVAPNAVTNEEFTRALGHAIHRPTIFPMPAFIARLLFGEMADELLLASARVRPSKLAAAGFEFKHTNINTALRYLLR